MARPRRARAGLVPALALLAGALPIVARGQDSRRAPDAGPRGVASPAAVSSPSRTNGAWRNPFLERTRSVVLEVIETLQAVHVDAEALTAARCTEEAIEALRVHVGSRAFHLLAGEPREQFRRALGRVPEGDLDACLGVVDAHLGQRSSEETWTVSDVLARGAISVTGDPFTRIVDQATLSRDEAAAMTGERPRGYGLKVRESAAGIFTIDHVFSGYDAADKGLADGDAIVEVDGRPLFTLSRDEVLRRLLGDGQLTLRIFRDGFAQSHDVDLVARFPREPLVAGDILPGAVGYVRLTGFVDRSSDELAAVLHQLEIHGIRALILDLRDNPGGTVESCVEVAGIFLGANASVCSAEKRDLDLRDANGLARITSFTVSTAGDASTAPKLPLVVLTNRGSASASEMLAGALRDTGKARIVGGRTYGKAVGQSPFPLASSSGQRWLVTSFLKYRTPSGRSPHKVGIVPDLEVAPFSATPAEQEELLRLTREGAFEQYLAKHGAPAAATLLALAKDDEGKPERYPGFETWVRGLGTSLRPEVLRRALRSALRSWAVRAKGLSFREDLRDDAQLKRAHEILAGEVAAAARVVPPPQPAPPAPPPVVRKRYF